MHKINKCVSVNLHMIPTAMRKLNKPLQQAIHKHAPNTLYQQKLKKPEQAKGQGNEWKLWNHSKQQQLKQPPANSTKPAVQMPKEVSSSQFKTNM